MFDLWKNILWENLYEGTSRRIRSRTAFDVLRKELNSSLTFPDMSNFELNQYLLYLNTGEIG